MYSVGVIGVGSIAQGYSETDEAYPYSHVGGILLSRKVHLAAVADLKSDVLDSFRAKWGQVLSEDFHYYESGSEMLSREKLDIVAVCTPGPTHFAVMQEVLTSAPRAIFLEKPPACSLTEMDTMIAAAASQRIPITMSYSRHWTPHILHLQRLVEEGLIGKVETIVGYSGWGVLSYAIHTTDLICQFAGSCPTAVYARGHLMADAQAPEGYEPEPMLDSAIIEFANGVTGIQVGNPGEHGDFYCEVFGAEGWVRAGLYVAPFAVDKLGKPIDLGKYHMPPNASVFTVAYDQIADHLDGGPLPCCTNDKAVIVNEIGFGSVESIATDRRIVLPNKDRTRCVYANG